MPPIRVLRCIRSAHGLQSQSRSFHIFYKDNAWWVNPPHNTSGVYTGDPVPCSLADEDNGIRSGKLFPYVGTSAAYHCPSDLSYLRVTSRGGKRSYAITAVMHGEVPNSPDCADLYSQIVRPSAKLVFLENNDTRGWAMGSWMMYCQWNPSSFSWIDPITAWQLCKKLKHLTRDYLIQ